MNRLIRDGGEKVYLDRRPDLWDPAGNLGVVREDGTDGESHPSGGCSAGQSGRPGDLVSLISHCLGSVLVCADHDARP